MTPAVFVDLWTGLAVASLEASALILLVLVIQRLLRRPLGPTWSFALWFVVLLRLSLPTLPVSSWTWPRPIESLRTQLWALPATLAPVPAVPVESVAVREPLPSTQPASDPVAPFTFGPTTRPESSPDSSLSTWAKLAAWLWLLGLLALAVRHWLGLALYRRTVRRWPLVADARVLRLSEECREVMGISRPTELRAAPDLETPCLFGVFRPVLLVPASLLQVLSDAEWRDILLHEFGHLRRRDPLTNAWMSLVGMVHWFNPLVAWAIRRMRQDRELACDQLVLAQSGQTTQQSYGATLLKLASYPAPGATTWQLERIGILEGAGPLKARLLALKARPIVWLNALLGVLAIGFLGSCALTRNPAVAEKPLEAISLEDFTDFPRELTSDRVLLRRQDDPGMWMQIPKGEQTFYGVPFNITGLVRLAGRNSQRLNAWYFRPEVKGIPIGRAFGRLYLLHTTTYYEKPGTAIATIRLNYADGRTADIPIEYGTDTLNYWRQRYESTAQLTGTDARIAWTGKAPPGVAEYGNSLRLILTSFQNPHPQRVVQSVDLISTWTDASEVIVGMAVGGPDLPAAWRDAPITRYPKNDWQGKLRFQAVNAVTGKPIRNVELRIEVAEPGVHSRIGTEYTDADGWATLRYPHADLNYITIWADHPEYVPRIIQWTRRQHGPFPTEFIYRAEPGVRIHGRVLNPAGEPLSGALVRLSGPRPDFKGDGKEFLALDHLSVTTDADGRWSCSEIPKEVQGTMSIRVLHPGYAEGPSQRLTSAELGGAEIVTRLSTTPAMLDRGANQSAKPEDIVLVEMRPDGIYYLQGKPLGSDLRVLESRLIDEYRKNPNLVVRIRANAGGKAELPMNIIEMCQRIGINRLDIATPLPAQR